MSCCLEVRDLLGCPAELTGPCLGFQGACADLVTQFADVYGTRLPFGYSCKKFPNEKSALHLVYVGLISAAIALPFGALVDGLFIEGNQPEFPELQLTAPRWLRAVGGSNGGWHFAALRPWLLGYLLMRFSTNLVKVPLEAVFSFFEAMADTFCYDGRKSMERRRTAAEGNGEGNGAPRFREGGLSRALILVSSPAPDSRPPHV